MSAPDLAALWAAHCAQEFEHKNAAATMATMTAEPDVNHVPTLTGGVGQAELAHFYATHFIPCNPADLELVHMSRRRSTMGKVSPSGDYLCQEV